MFLFRILECKITFFVKVFSYPSIQNKMAEADNMSEFGSESSGDSGSESDFDEGDLAINGLLSLKIHKFWHTAAKVIILSRL